MKKILPIIFLIMLPIVIADDQMLVDSIRVYVNDVRISDADEYGGEIEDVMPNDILEFRIEIENLDSNEKLTDILIYGEIEDIDDGDDLEEDLSEFDLRKNEKETRSLTFEIPSDAEEDDYDINIKIRGINKNGTEEVFNVTYELSIYESTTSRFSVQEALNNITKSCEYYQTDITELKNAITETTTKCQDCGTIEQIKAEKISLETEKNSCENDKNRIQKDYEQLRNDLTECQNENRETEIMMAQNQKLDIKDILIWGGLIIAAIFVWKKYFGGVGGPTKGTGGSGGFPMSLSGGKNVG